MATLRNINITSISALGEIPEIPTNFISTKIPCGENIALNTLRDVQDQIKTKLASGKGALGELGTLIQKGQDALSKVQEKINEAYSFQDDINSIKNDPSPANIAQVLQRYKGKIPELDRYIQLASDITNTTELDICSAIPNIKIDIETGLVSVDAKDSITPNQSPLDAIPLVSTVKDFFNDTSKSPSGISHARLEEYELKVSAEIKKQVLDPSLKEEETAIDEYLKQVKILETSGIFVKTKTYGKTPEELQSLGLLTLDEIQKVDRANEARKNSELYTIKTQVLALSAFPETMNAKNNDENASYDLERIDSEDANFMLKFNTSLDKIDKIAQGNKELIADYVAHLNASTPADIKLAIKAGENLVALQEPPVHINTVARPTNTRGRV